MESIEALIVLILFVICLGVALAVLILAAMFIYIRKTDEHEKEIKREIKTLEQMWKAD